MDRFDEHQFTVWAEVLVRDQGDGGEKVELFPADVVDGWAVVPWEVREYRVIHVRSCRQVPVPVLLEDALSLRQAYVDALGPDWEFGGKGSASSAQARGVVLQWLRADSGRGTRMREIVGPVVMFQLENEAG